MKKNTAFKGFSIAILSLFLSSCSNGNITSFDEYNTFVKDNDSYNLIDTGVGRKAKNYKSLEVKYGLGGNEIKTYDSFQKTSNDNYVSSVGSQDLLVIPVEFTDAESTTYCGDKEASIINIENAFFGTSRTSVYESVASYYNKSSYGKLKLTGKVSNWFKYDKATAASLVNVAYNDRASKVNEIANRAIEWYKANNSDFSRFDKDNDGNPDSLRLIYSLDYLNSNNFFWAYTVYNQYPTSWMSYKSLGINEKGYTNPTTAIHETGHIFGLQDYYDYSNTFTPLGYLDMMDCNIGDHSPFSKMVLNWTRPYEVYNPGEIKINSFNESGDVLLLGNNWNGTCMDEYLLIAFFTPTNLNMHHSKENYSTKLFSKLGVVVYHIDARMRYTSFPKTLLSETTYQELVYYGQDVTLGFSNSSTTKFLCEMISKKTSDPIYARGKAANDDDLFTKGDKFDFDNFSFHDGKKLPYHFEIKEITNGYATILFS